MEIILLCGWSESGKDTVADIMTKLYGFKKYAFANPLKDICATLYGFPRELADTTEGKKQTWKVGYKTKTIREILLETALLDRARFGEDVYANEIIMKLVEDNPRKVVISDLRYKNEIKAMELFAKSNGYNLQVWKVVREGQTESPVKDPSEYNMISLEPDYIIHNNGISLEDLESKILEALNRKNQQNELPTSQNENDGSCVLM